MQYPDYSQLWLNEVKENHATSAIDFSTFQDRSPVSFNSLGASRALGKKTYFGSWNDKPLCWTVISVNHTMALLLCDTILEAKQLYSDDIDPKAPGWWCETPSWINSDIKTWLNLTFLSKAFNLSERVSIQPIFGDCSPNPDMAAVLSAEEVEAYVPQSLRACMETSWWLKNPSSFNEDAKPTYVDDQGKICTGGTAQAFRGIRPIITVNLYK